MNLARSLLSIVLSSGRLTGAKIPVYPDMAAWLYPIDRWIDR